MQIRLNILFVLAFGIVLSQPMNAQFNQELDSTIVGFINDMDTTKTFCDLSGIHQSSHMADVAVFDSNYDYLNHVDATRVIQSQSAGLLINANSYTPGASSSVLLRGYRSFLGANQPIIILDGMPIDNNEWGNGIGGVDQSNRLVDINPNDIESVKLIKSAAGRAKYGIVGGNGVILMSTKKGDQHKPTISVRTSLTIDQLSSMPALQNTFAQGRQADGLRMYRGPETGEGFSWGPAVSELEYDGSNYDFDKNGRLVSKGLGNGNQANTYDPLEFFQSGLSSNLNASVKGGGQSLHYYASAGLNNLQGVIPKNKYKRYNILANVDYHHMDKLSIVGSAAYTSSNAIRSQKGSNIQGVMLGLLRTAPTFDNSNNNSDPVNDSSTYELENGNQRSYRNGIYDSPYWTINKNPHEDHVNRRILNLRMNYSVLENLDLRLVLGNDHYTDERIGGVDINPGRGIGIAYDQKNKYNAQNSEITLNYLDTPTAGLQLNTSIGINYNLIKQSFNIQNATDLISANNVTVDNGRELTSTFDELDRKRFGTVLAFDANYKEYLHIDASIRQDYSNRFGEDTNGYLSYGLGFGLELDKLFFYGQESETAHILLHASIGKFGSDILAGSSHNKYTTSSIIGGDGFINPIMINSPELSNVGVNKNLTAESTESFDFGLDFKSKDGRYYFGLMFYKEESTGLLVNRETGSSSGISSIIENSGAIENRGFEFSLGVDIINHNNYTWKVDLALSKNINKVTAINDIENSIELSGLPSTHTVATVGEEYGVIMGSGFSVNDNGQLIIDDQGFPLASNDLKVGNPNPDWIMYINNTISLHSKINISASIDIKAGGDLWCGTCGVLDYFGRSETAASEVGQSVFFPGVTENNQINSVEAQLAPSNGNSDDFYRVRYGFGGLTEMSIFDASWVRLRTVSIDYDITDIIQSKNISHFTIGLFANNWLVVSNYPGIDPETNLMGNSGSRGIDYFNNPGTRQLGAVVNLSF